VEPVVLELEPAVAFSVVAQGVDLPPFRFEVRLNDTPVGSLVTIESGGESWVDRDGDGVVESYDGSYRMKWNGVDPAPGDVVSITVAATAPTGDVIARDAASIEGHLETSLTDFVEGLGTATEPAILAVLTHEAAVTAQSLRILLDGVDVSARVNVTGPITVDDLPSPADPTFVHYRFQQYELDLSPIAPAAGSTVQVEVTAYTPVGPTASMTSAAAVVAAGLDPWQEWAVRHFVERLKLKKEGGKVKLGDGVTPCEVKAAIDQLQQNLDPDQPEHPGNPPAGPGEPEKPTEKSKEKFPGGQKSIAVGTMNVVVAVGALGKKATANGNADLIVAAGGDSSGSGKNGGDATASNKQSGGMTIAAGGDGDFASAEAGNGNAAAKGDGTALGMGGSSHPSSSSTPKNPGYGDARAGTDDGHVSGSKSGGGGGYVMVGAAVASGTLDC
ncbi:MAG: hypothetical protein ACF8XB_02055, partial [Planctomycetota bacterium JB042]